MANHKLNRLNMLTVKAVIAFLLLGGGRALSVTYTAIDLNPSGFTYVFAKGISNAQQVGYGSSTSTDNYAHALLWNGTAQSAVDLNPSGFTESYAYGTSGTQQVGYGKGTATGGYNHAVLWNGSAGSAVDLHPSGFMDSYAYATSGTQQVGKGFGLFGEINRNHALLWNGTAGSVVDLHPSGASESSAFDTNGFQQVGHGYSSSSNLHALLWNGTANSAVDLNPLAFSTSTASSICGTQQVGSGRRQGANNHDHALLWSGTAGSVVDLNPSGFEVSYAIDNNYTQQVGYGNSSYIVSPSHALLWNGTANSMIDLHQFLPSDFTRSYATSIDFEGNIIGYAVGASGTTHAILWEPCPETFTWKGPANGHFNQASNWLNNSIPNGSYATAILSGNLGVPSTVTLDSPIILAGIIFDSSQSYTLAGFTNLIFKTKSGNVSINLESGSHHISAPVVLQSDAVISGSGVLDLSGGISGDYSLTVLGTLSVRSIQVSTLTIGNIGITAVPEPSTFVLLGMGVFGLVASTWRRSRKAAWFGFRIVKEPIPALISVRVLLAVG